MAADATKLRAMVEQIRAANMKKGLALSGVGIVLTGLSAWSLRSPGGGSLNCFMLGIVTLVVGLVMLVARGWGDAGLRLLLANPERAIGALVVEPLLSRSGQHTLTRVKVEMDDGTALLVTVPAEHETDFLAALGTRGEILRLPEQRG